jgi:hypothetical protein
VSQNHDVPQDHDHEVSQMHGVSQNHVVSQNHGCHKIMICHIWGSVARSLCLTNLIIYCCISSGKAPTINFKLLWFDRSGFEPMNDMLHVIRTSCKQYGFGNYGNKMVAFYSEG